MTSSAGGQLSCCDTRGCESGSCNGEVVAKERYDTRYCRKKRVLAVELYFLEVVIVGF